MSVQHLMGLVSATPNVLTSHVYVYSYCTCGWVGRSSTDPDAPAEAWRDHLKEVANGWHE